MVRRNRLHIIPCYDDFNIQPNYDLPQQTQLLHFVESDSNGVSIPNTAATTITNPHQGQSLSSTQIQELSYDSMSSAIPTRS